jgi:hypothetical protein
MRNFRAATAALLLAALAAGCKSPRPPHEAAEGDVSGEWTAESVATTRPEPAGEIRWRLLMDEQDGGRLRGDGSLAHPGGSDAFTVVGIRGESTVNFEMHLEAGATARFDGSILDVKTMVGQVDLGGDTIPVTFTRP